MIEANPFVFAFPGGHHHVQHSYPVLVTRRGQGRRLPPTPCKPSTLQLKPANINFPKLNASPTHVKVRRAGDDRRELLTAIPNHPQTHHSTPYSVHSLPHSRDLLRDRDMFYNERERGAQNRLQDYDLRYECRDRERERFELEREREYEMERERWVKESFHVSEQFLIFFIFRFIYHTPLSFEQALAMGRTGRPSPVLNGYKPKGGGYRSRHSDSDEEDWC